jgi:hypothetical protein
VLPWRYAYDDGEEILNKTEDRVPANPLGENPFLREYSEKEQVPLLGAWGALEPPAANSLPSSRQRPMPKR